MDSIQRTCLRALLTFIVGGAAVHVVAMVIGRDGALHAFADSQLYYAIMIAAALACLWRGIAVPRDRLAWVLIGVGVACWAGGDLHWTLVYSDDAKAPYPSLADALYLAYYPLVAAGILALVVAGARRLRGMVLLDGAIAGVGAAAIGAALLGPAIAGYSRNDPVAALVDAAYPVGDMVILGGVAAAAVVLGWRRDFALLSLGLLAMTAADIAYLSAAATTGYVEGGITDSGWVVAAALTALAAWQPRGRPRGLASDARAIALPSLFAIAAIALLVSDHFDRRPEAVVWLAGATLALAVARLVLAFAENAGLLATARSDALTDALTGIGNRRLLVEDLERACAAAERGRGEYVLAIFDLDGFKGYNDTFGHPAGDALLARLGGKLATVPGPDGAAYRLGGDEFCLISPIQQGEAEPLIDSACAALTERGEGFEIETSFGAILLPEEATDSSQALQVADERLYAQKYGRRGESERTMAALLEALSLREPDLQTQLAGVGTLAVDIGRMLELRRDELEELDRAAQLHDLGKLAVPDEILHKPGPLDEREWAFVRQHTIVGERILRASPALRSVSGIVRATHENWDGTGYPDGKVGEEIPLAARIVYACNAFVAMTTGRPYRKAMPVADALNELMRCAGTQFDPDVVRALVTRVRDEQEAERAA